MRRLIMWNMVTLDGYFDGERSWEINWHRNVWGEELERIALESRSTDMLLFERRSYEGMAAYWSSATGATADFINTIPKVVFSRTLENAAWSNTRVVRSEPAEEVANLKRQPGKDLLIFGGAALPATLAQRGLIDEYRLGVQPIVLSDGSPSFESKPPRLSMKLLEARPSKSGRMVLRYEAGVTKAHHADTRHRLHRNSRMARATFSATRRSAVDGPFVETKEWALGSATGA